MDTQNIYYTYVYVDPRKPNFSCENYNFPGEPFYVGKGKNKRAWIHLTESKTRTHNTLKHNKIQRILSENVEPLIIFICKNVTEEEAMKKERELITLIGTKWNIPNVNRGPLCNMTSGGDGCSPCEELKQKFAHKGQDNGMWRKTHSVEARERISSYRKTFRHTEEVKRKMKEQRSDGKNYNTKCWLVQLPNGDQIVVSYLRKFCEDNNINYNSLYDTFVNQKPITRGKSTGYWLKEEVSLA